MITTVTTTTVTIMTAMSVGVLAGLGGLVVLFLILLLASKEVATTEVGAGKAGAALRTLSGYIEVPILPLILVFVMIVVAKVLRFL